MNDTINQSPNGDSPKISNMESCVLCDKLTNESKDTHIDLRYNYIDGVGQLCIACAKQYN